MSVLVAKEAQCICGCGMSVSQLEVNCPPFSEPRSTRHGFVPCCQSKSGMGLRYVGFYEKDSELSSGCPYCWCQTKGCNTKVDAPGWCSEHEGYYVAREEEAANRELREGLENLQKKVLELAAFALAPYARALCALDEAEEIRHLAYEGLEPIDDRWASHFMCNSRSRQEQQRVAEVTFVSENDDALVPRGTKADSVDSARFSWENLQELLGEAPAHDSGNPASQFRRPEGREAMNAAGLLEKVKAALVYAEVIE